MKKNRITSKRDINIRAPVLLALAVSFTFAMTLFFSSRIARADLTDDLMDEPDRTNTAVSDKTNSDTDTNSEPKNDIDNQNLQNKNDSLNQSNNSDIKSDPKGKNPSSENTKKKPKQKNKKPGPDNSDEPVVFESEGLRGAKFDGLIELQKNVIVSQGDFRMDANEAKVIFSKQTEEVEKVIAKGNVKIFKIDPKTGQKIRARGNTITFNEKKQTIEIVGNARFWRGKDLVRGKKIIYNLKTGWLNASKVEGVITPGEKNKK